MNDPFCFRFIFKLFLGVLFENVIFRSMKNSLFIFLSLLWICFHSFAGNEPSDSPTAYLYIQVPSNLKPKKYTYFVKTTYVNKKEISVGCSNSNIYGSRQIVKCEIERERYSIRLKDSLVDLKFTVQSPKWGTYYSHHQVRLKITSDSMFYVIPDLPEEIDSIMSANGNDFRNFSRQKDFVDFMTNWKSCFLYANFFQGHRPYGELSFSNARYTESLGFVRGLTYGSEFNFLWRKDDFILGPKMGFQVTTDFFNFGLSGVYYTDFRDGTFCLKPRIGVNPGIPWISASYEYAIRFGPNYFGNRINSHQFSVYFLIPLKTVNFR